MLDNRTEIMKKADVSMDDVDDLLSEAMADRLEDYGQLMYVPPERKLSPLNEEDLDANADVMATQSLRAAFEPERMRILKGFQEAVQNLKNPEIPSEHRLSEDFTPEFDDEDIDLVLYSYLEGDDDDE